MQHLSPAKVLRETESFLKKWLDGDVRFERDRGAKPDDGPDLVVRQGRLTLLLEMKMTSQPASIAAAVNQARHFAVNFGKGSVPIVVVPFMGEVGQQLCERGGVSWFDLSGNARIVAPGLRIHVEGKPNKFKRFGRPSTAFAPRSSRVVRQLLIATNRSFHQRELSRLTGLDEGFTSRIVRKLEADGLIARDDSGAVRPGNPDLLLDAWREAYDFTKHHVIRGHVATRSAEEAQLRLVEVLKKRKRRCAATGLGAAWLLSRFASFRLITLYVDEEPEESLLAQAGFRTEERGANIWLVVPKDEGVFAGATEHERVPCVHPVQVYLDLKAHPERASEAAIELRKQLLTWRR